MTRLTKMMRDAITKKIVDTTFNVRKDARAATEDALARRVIKSVCGDDVFERIKEIPNGWLPTARDVYTEGGISLRLSESIQLPALISYRGSVRIPDEALRQEAREHSMSAQDEYENEKLLRNQIKAVLASFTTVEKLAVGWPEGYEQLSQELLQEPTPGLPAPRITDLNQRIEDLRITIRPRAKMSKRFGKTA
jgi:hypothetical protein